MPSIEPVKARHKLLATSLAFTLIAGCGSGDDVERNVPNTLETPAALGARYAPRELPIRELEDAHQALREGRFEEAAAAFEGFASEAVDGIEEANAHLGAAIAWTEAGDPERGIKNLRLAHQAAPDDSQVWRRAGYLLADGLRDAGEAGEAADLLRPLVEANHSDALQPYIDAAFASAAVEAGDLDDANDAWDRALA